MMIIDHIGYAVKRIDRAITAFQNIGYEFEPMIDDTERNVKLAFGVKDGYRIELVSPLDKSLESPVDYYLVNNIGTPYHICYQSDSFDSDVESLVERGYKIVIPAQRAVAFNGKKVIFLINIGFGLMEIVEAY